MKKIITLIFALILIFCLGYGIGVRSKMRAVRMALITRDDADRIEVAKAFITAVRDDDINDIISTASGQTWGSSALKARVPMSKLIAMTYGVTRIRESLGRANSFRLGPKISKQFLTSAAPFLVADVAFKKLDKGIWPNWRKQPRAVIYTIDDKAYFLITVWENGGWRVIGTPASSQACWLKSDDYSATLREWIRGQR
ncbi:MAG: hypothetical protein NT018_11815 [Armatimonadetes bacterium]|nr:hypothetical protein [Armatimonadota bacterium]